MTPESASSLSSNDKGPAEPGPGSGDGCPANLSPNPGVEERSELYGLTFLNKQQFGDVAEAKEAQYPVDIVAIPGIGGDDYKTWTHSDGKFWLRDFLPGQLPGARVFTFSYPSEVAFALETGQLRDCARTLLVGLNSVRQTAEELSRPIILVCHSVGGFVAKQALVAAEDYANIRDSVVGILFLGTPHRGSSTTQFPEVLTRITDVALADSPRFTDKMRKDLFESLEKGSDILKTISTEFKNQVSNIRIVSFIEQNTIPPSKQRVVDEISGTMDVPKETIVPMDGYDHRDICRFEDYTSSGYQTVFSRLEKLAGAAHSKSPAFTGEERVCLGSLSFEGTESRRHNIGNPLENTCTWLFSHPSYCDWESGRRRNEHNGLLWIKGKPGSGKSTLMKQALQRAEERASRHRTANHVAVAAFFFNARGSVLERNPLGLFRSLLRQLLQQIRPLLSGFLPSFLQKNEPWQDWSWSLEELREHFYTAVTQAQGHSIVIFVDALDECDEESVRKTVEFFERAALSAVSAGCDLRICLSSRHYTNINIRNCFEIRTEDCNKTDISKYVRTKLAIGTRVSNFEEIINAKASGTFLWVVLVVTRLSEAKRNGESTNTLLDILKSAPIGLRELFRQIAGAIPEAERRETAQMMLWVLLSERSLTPTELRYALASKFPYKSQKEYEESPEFVADDEHMEELLRKRTMGLIEVTRAGQGMACIVQFIHESVRDFLLRENGLHIVDPSLGGGAIGEGHSQIVKSCINYVSAEELLVSPEVIDERGPSRSSRYLLQVLAINYPFLNYSVTSLFEHAVKAEREGVSQAHLSHDFQDDAFDSWRYHSDLIKHGRFTDREGSQTTLLHTVSEYGLFTATDALLKQGVDVNAKGGREGNALVASAGAGHNQIVQLLLENGADVNAKGTHSTALQAASSKGHYEVVELLLRNGADVHAPGPLGTALQVASSRNRYKIAELLLEKGADVNAQGGGGGNALHSAAFDGYVEIAKLLLENGANVNAQEGAYSNPLLAASMMGRSQMVELLLEAGADVTVRDGDYGSNALQTASSFNHSAVVALLLAKGADVNAQGGVYGTALQAASYSGCSQTATLLLEKGADVNAQAGDYGTALQAASLMGHTATASLLLQHGADVNAQAGRHSSALQAAACNGHAETAALLLAHHADVNAHGGRDGSALQAAAFAGHTPVVSLLLEHAADVGALGGRYGTALGAAEDAGHGEIVAVLRARGA